MTPTDPRTNPLYKRQAELGDEATAILLKLQNQVEEFKKFLLNVMDDEILRMVTAESFDDCPECIYTDDGHATNPTPDYYVCDYHQSDGKRGNWS